MYEFIFKINKRLNKNKYDFLTKINREEQERFINNLYKENMTEDERSYSQYKCQIDEYHLLKKIFYNAVSFVFMVPFIILCVIFRYLKNAEYENNNYNIAVFWGGKDTSIIPESLKENYYISESKDCFALNYKDIKFILNEIIKRHIFSFYYNMKVVFKIAIYRGNIIRYNPSTFIVTSEYSFTSSILTKYCDENNINHINIMHGDKFFRKRNSFFKFNKCYVWDEHYKNLFINLKAEPSQFVIEVPKKFLSSTYANLDYDKRLNLNTLTYYLQNDTKDVLISIRENLRKINSDITIAVRPHPRYCDKELVNLIFNEFIIEDAEKVGIDESILNADYVVSLYSTVLFQANLQNKNVVIDDLIDPIYYNKLKELDYIMTYKKHLKFSDLIY